MVSSFTESGALMFILSIYSFNNATGNMRNVKKLIKPVRS